MFWFQNIIMRIDLFVFFSVFMLHGFSQSISVDFTHGVVDIASVNYEQRLNKVIYVNGGIGCAISDSIKIEYNTNAYELKVPYKVYSPSIQLAIGAKSNTNPLYCFGSLNANISTLKFRQYLSMGLGYNIRKVYLRLSSNYTLTNVGYGIEVGLNF
jgi:hypothetical protein